MLNCITIFVNKPIRATALYIFLAVAYLLQIYGTSALSLHKKQSSTYQNCQGWQWFQTESSSHCELADKECTRMFILCRACGCFLCAPSICTIYFKRLTEGLSSSLSSVRNFA